MAIQTGETENKQSIAPIKYHKGFLIVKSKFAHHAFDGEGARQYGGRWNSPGHYCIYLSSSISLSTLEILVQLEDTVLLNHYTLFQVQLPTSFCQRIASQELPRNWQADAGMSTTQRMGDRWLKQQSSVALWVPSAIIPQEENILLNPLHPDFNQITSSISQLNDAIDERLL